MISPSLGNATPTELMRGNNRTWWLLYYDELADREDYQLSLVDEQDIDGYYNCAHAVRRCDRDTIAEIEAF